MSRNEWEAAAAAAANIQRLLPNEPKVIALQEKVKQAKAPYRRHLMRQFREAANGDDPELALELLKELDKYLTRDEAAPIRQLAQDVVERARLHMGERFKTAIHNKDWHTAVWIGTQIIREFENTRMAQEARQIIEQLRERAGK